MPFFILFVFTAGVDAQTLTQDKGAWKVATPSLTVRSELAMAAIGHKIYMIGGFLKPSLFTYFYNRLRNRSGIIITNLAEEYDTSLDTWKPIASLPEGLHHSAAGTVRDRLFVIGGFGKTRPAPRANVYMYNPTTNSWKQRAPMPSPRGALAVAVFNGKLFAIGGKNYDGNSSAVEVYNPENDTWDVRAPLPTPRDHLTVATFGQWIYAIGGRINGDYSRNLATVEAYNPMEDIWKQVADLPTARSGMVAGVIGETIYVVGGENPINTFSANEAYDPKTDRWREMAPMPTARHGLGVASVKGRLYTISGGPTPGGSSGQQFSNINEVFTPPH